jgi:glycosyltransferase involved in cell wall biosynthesis
MPVVSVVVPNYNHAPFLEQRIESILTQTFKEFELIILDDCSSDHSMEIIEGYRLHPKVTHIVRNETNSGATFKQWQKGINLAAGNYIWIAESDDWCEPTLLETLVKGITDNENVVISYCGSLVVQDNDEILYTSLDKKLSRVTDGTTFIKSSLTESNIIFNASMALFSKESFQEISLEFTEYKFIGDWLFWILMAQKGQVFTSGKYLNYFRKHGSAVSGRSMDDGTYYREYQKLANYLLENNLVDKSRFIYLLYKKYKKLIHSGIAADTKKILRDSYRAVIGPGNIKRLQTAEVIHDAKISAWIITPPLIKNTIRKILPGTGK